MMEKEEEEGQLDLLVSSWMRLMELRMVVIK
jgi:hypothetical protein